MAGGYLIDPATGQPAVKTAGGAFLPIPLSREELEAAGVAGADERLASNDVDLGRYITRPGAPAPLVADIGSGSNVPPMKMADFSKTLGPVGVGVRMVSNPDAPARILAPGETVQEASPQMRTPTLAEQRTEALKASSFEPTAKTDELAQHSEPGAIAGGGGVPGAPGARGIDPLTQQVFEEALRRSGGGPRRLGVAGETRKYTTTENPGGDPALAAQSQEALDASDKYNEMLAISLRDRQQQAYEAQQGEYAARAGQMAAAQQRFEAQQSMLQDYQAKRDAMVQEAAQMKTPQMEDYWQSRGTFANVMTGLSIALGGALQGMRGGGNIGLEMANQSIDRWIAEQKEAYNRAEGRINDADNQFAKMVQMFGSENLATEHMREQAWTVRDSMLKSYAEKIGTPDALENYNQAMLQTDAQRAALRARASQGAAVEIEQRLSMQGGGGGGSTLAAALAKAAAAEKDRRVVTGEDQKPDPAHQRAITEGTTDKIGGALTTIRAAKGVKSRLQTLGVAEDDTDDPRSGAYDYVTKNIPGTETRRTGQDLDQDTFDLARGAQQFLGKSDNDAALAEKQAAGLGASGRERFQGASRLERKATTQLKLEVAGLTPEQRQQWFNALPPDEKQMVTEILGGDSRPAGSAQVVR